jgi:hypothetical protein
LLFEYKSTQTDAAAVSTAAHANATVPSAATNASANASAAAASKADNASKPSDVSQVLNFRALLVQKYKNASSKADNASKTADVSQPAAGAGAAGIKSQANATNTKPPPAAAAAAAAAADEAHDGGLGEGALAGRGDGKIAAREARYSIHWLTDLAQKYQT